MSESIPFSPLPFHRFRNLSSVADLVHGVFTRHGGVSRPPYATLNVAWSNGDSLEAVRENLSRVKSAMGLETLVSSRQVHGDGIHLIDEAAIARARDREPILLLQPGDALVTRLRGVGLLIKTADCQAVFLVDATNGVIANVHCGWRGSVAQLPVKVVQFMKERLGCRPGDLLAAIGPSLGPCCAEFRNYREELPPSFYPFETKPLHFDFWRITRACLVDAGLHPEHIETAGICTVCAKDRFFSHRGEGKTGRNAAVLGWKP
ncbi:MAG: laccase domain-containing protein [Deltaproteobacteria bacterium]|nr:laccase domain-containing protein [Deltaproteobacteria bacterium]